MVLKYEVKYVLESINFIFNLHSYFCSNGVELTGAIHFNQAEKKSKNVFMYSQDIVDISASYATENKSVLPNRVDFIQKYFS